MDILDNRKKIILKTLINDYVSTAEPVASSRLVSFYNFDVRGATIRSEMNELSALGFLLQPHKSGGRIPTDLGYRFYVDNLMERIDFNSDVLKIVGEALKNKAEIEAAIKSAALMLSDITGFISVASFPKISSAKLKYVSVSDYSLGKVLFVFAFSNGYIVHKITDFSFRDKMYSLENAVRFIYDLFFDKNIDYILNYSSVSVYDDIIRKVCEVLKDYSGDFMSNTEYVYEGVGKILKYPEFKNLAKLQTFLETLEDRQKLGEIFRDTDSKVTVKIGTENRSLFMREYSLISVKYNVMGSEAGVIGIIGPTRMDYAISIAAVKLISVNLGLMLAELSS